MPNLNAALLISQLENLQKLLSSKRNIAMVYKELFTEKNITIKRPGTGISPMKWDSILGKVAERDYQLDDLL